MPDDSLSDAIREAYACCPTSVVILETIEISHPLVAESLYLVRNNEEIVATLETDEVVTFQPVGFRMSLPASGENGIQELSLAVDNIDRVASDFIEQVYASSDPVIITYRPYRSDDLTQHGLGDNPLILTLTDVRINSFEVSGKATFGDLLNKPFLTENYTRKRFPSLGS